MIARVLVSLLLLVPVAAYPFQNEPPGFRTYPWDSSVTAIAGLRPVGQPDGQVRRYFRMDESLHHAGLDLAEILYVADGGRLMSVELSYDCVQYKKMVEGLRQRYGAPTGESTENGLTWQGLVTTVTLGTPVPAKLDPTVPPPLCRLTFTATSRLLKKSPEAQK